MLVLRILVAIALTAVAGGITSRDEDVSPCAPVDESATDILNDYRWTDTTTDTRRRTRTETLSGA